MKLEAETFNRPLITPKELAALWHLSKNVIYNLMNNEHDFPVVQFNSRKYINRELLEKWLVEHTAVTKDKGKKSHE